ncbi:MAG: PIN domain-containing protein [Deltaproteobacteria bacterium]|nr:PIN domain-containing protein [Deltaproteobacteria bacterium]
MAARADAVALDTSCVVALVCAWHPDHAATLAPIERRLDAGATLVLPGPALVESYAVLTRLPAPHRLAPADAWRVLEASLRRPARLVSLSAAEHWELLALLAAAGIAGGATYDGLIATAARKAGAGVLVTWNLRHFARWADKDLAVVTPAELC